MSFIHVNPLYEDLITRNCALKRYLILISYFIATYSIRDKIIKAYGWIYICSRVKISRVCYRRDILMQRIYATD